MADWTPLNLGPQLAAWFDPSDPDYVVFDTTNTANVSKIYNKSPNGGIGTLSAYVSGGGPTFSATARNGKPGLIFAANSKMVTAGLPTGTNPMVLLVVGQATTTGYRAAFAQGGTNVRVAGIRNSPNYVYISNKSGSDINSTSVWLNNDAIVVGAWDASGEYLAVNGGSLLTRAVATSVDSASAFIGAYNAGDASGFTGVIQQIVIVSGQLTDDMRARLEGWSAWKTGNQAKLPTTHTYYNAPPTVDNNFASSFVFTDDTKSQSTATVSIAASAINVLAGASSVGSIAVAIKARSTVTLDGASSIGVISSKLQATSVKTLDDVISIGAANLLILAQGISTLDSAASRSTVSVGISADSMIKLEDAKSSAAMSLGVNAVSVIKTDDCKTFGQIYATLQLVSTVILEDAKTIGTIEKESYGNVASSKIILQDALSRSVAHLLIETYAIDDETVSGKAELTTVAASPEITLAIAKAG